MESDNSEEKQFVNDTAEGVKGKKGAGWSARTLALTFVCIILGIVVTFEYKTIKSSLSQQTDTTETIEEYQATIIELSNTIDYLKNERDELKEKVSLFENSTEDEQLEALEEQSKTLRTFACLTPCTGEGVVITLNYNDPADISGTSSMILTLLNELKSSGAQAISVNGERLHAMSEARVISDYIIINGNAYYAPITINVIGDAKNLISSLDMSGIKTQFENYFKLNGGSLSIDYNSVVTVPALSEEYLKSITNLLKDAS